MAPVSASLTEEECRPMLGVTDPHEDLECRVVMEIGSPVLRVLGGIDAAPPQVLRQALSMLAQLDAQTSIASLAFGGTTS